ncbi:MAG: glycosyltransferase family 8 protein [Lachnospiraceae bacterium]|jgi:lipopolysaccharide biosynthesis glycosyltransferase|nr:glycosyltransferase family 8 protein [Lachnospiraceae bacterium]
MSLNTTHDAANNIAHIVYACDNKFAEILGVSLISLYENSKDINIVVYVLDSGLTEENRKKIEGISQKYGSVIVWVQAINIAEELRMNVAADRGSLSQYARLFVSRNLPEKLGRVLYLDCDIIVRKSIKELWEMNLHGKTAAALMDAFSKYYRRNIDLEENDIMFNSGVMLIDLKRWKEKRIEKRLIEFISSKHGYIQQGDQGALNAVLSHDVYCFEPRFNAVTTFFDFSYKEMLIYRKPPRFYEEEAVQKAVEDPNIIHFTTSFLSKRPWMDGCEHKYTYAWLRFKELSPWKEEPLWIDSRKQWKLTGAKIIKRLPRGIGIRLAGLLQVYGRPMVNRLRQQKRQKENPI